MKEAVQQFTLRHLPDQEMFISFFFVFPELAEGIEGQKADGEICLVKRAMHD